MAAEMFPQPGRLLQESNREDTGRLLGALHREHRPVSEVPPVLQRPLLLLQAQQVRRQGADQVLRGARIQRHRPRLEEGEAHRKRLPRVHSGQPRQVRRQQREGPHWDQQPRVGLLLFHGRGQFRNLPPFPGFAAAASLRRRLELPICQERPAAEGRLMNSMPLMELSDLLRNLA